MAIDPLATPLETREPFPAQVKTREVDASPVAGRRTWTLGILAAVVACALVAASSPLGVDYLAPPCDPQICDDPGPAISALAHGDLHGFFASQPPMGSFSLVLRTPAALIGADNDLLVYRLGVFVCLMGAGLLALWLAMTLIRRGRPWTLWALVSAAVLINPLTYQAARYGHPEEVLAAALAVGAVLAAGRRHWLLAGALLGCAIATKQWAALAVLPALLAAPGGTRVRVAVTCAALVAVLTVPMLAGDPGRFRAAQEKVSTTADYTYTVTASNLWWRFATESTGRGTDENGQATTLTQFSLPASFGRATHLGVIAVALLLSLLYWRGRSRSDRSPDDALLLLALLLLLRGVLDPLTVSYHHVPFLVALLVYEGLRRPFPVMSAYAIGGALLLTQAIAPSGDPGLVNAFYLAWTIPLAGAMAVSLFAPSATTGAWLGTSRPRRAMYGRSSSQ